MFQKHDKLQEKHLKWCFFVLYRQNTIEFNSFQKMAVRINKYRLIGIRNHTLTGIRTLFIYYSKYFKNVALDIFVRVEALVHVISLFLNKLAISL